MPNAIGFILGSAQLILNTIYRKKSVPAKSEEKKKNEDDSAQLVKREVEMGVYDDGGKARVKNHRFIEGRSLPNPSIARQYSL